MYASINFKVELQDSHVETTMDMNKADGVDITLMTSLLKVLSGVTQKVQAVVEKYHEGSNIPIQSADESSAVDNL